MRHVLEIFAHAFGNGAHADAGEVVDGEACVAWVVRGEETFEAWLEHFVLETLLEFLHAHGL